MARSAIRIEGLDDLADKMRRLGLRANQAMKPGVLSGAEKWRDLALAEAPGPHVEIELDLVGPKRVEATIGPDAEHWYYQFFETGAAAHEIRAKNRKALLFQAGNEQVFAKKVRHGGLAARPFLKPPFTASKEQIVGAVGEEWKKIGEVSGAGG